MKAEAITLEVRVPEEVRQQIIDSCQGLKKELEVLEALHRVAKAARHLLLSGYEFDWQAPGFGDEDINALHTALDALPEYALPGTD